jgi:hypothetical protein
MKLKLLTIFIVAMVLLSAAAPKARAWWLVDQFGQLIFSGQSGQVLGDENKDEGRRESEVRSGERKIEEFKPNEGKTEIRFGDENRIRTEFKPGENKTEIRQGETRIKLERKDGEMKMKIKNELTGEEREMEFDRPEEIEMRKEIEEKMDKETELLRIREREDKNEIRIGSDSGRFVIKKNRVGAVSDFPLSVDLSTNTLSVTTPAGEKQVMVFPDQAVQNMLSRNVIDQIGGQEAGDLATRVRMSQKADGTLVYEMEGEKQERLFGLMPVKFKKTAVVSTETGELVETRQNFRDRILEFISF